MEDLDNFGSFGGEVVRVCVDLNLDWVVVMELGEWCVLEVIRIWLENLGCLVDILDDICFLSLFGVFWVWVSGCK